MSRLVLLCALVAPLSAPQFLHAQAPKQNDPGEAKITASVSIEAPNAAPAELYAAIAFTDDFAVAATIDDPASDVDFRDGIVFNLSRPSYFDSSQDVWIDLKACKEWEKASIARTKQGLSKAPKEIRSAVEAMIEPNFQVQELPNGDLSISNSRLKYVIKPDKEISKEMLKKYYEYDRLNAYHKAMTEKAFPPTPQLAVDEILLKRNLFPKKLAATIWSPNGDVKIGATTRIEILDSREKADAEIAIEKANAKKAN